MKLIQKNVKTIPLRDMKKNEIGIIRRWGYYKAYVGLLVKLMYMDSLGNVLLSICENENSYWTNTELHFTSDEYQIELLVEGDTLIME